MATLSISRRFPVDAPPERVLAYLTTPSLLVYCLPGAELTSSSDDGRSHEGTVTVKLGALSVSYRGTATFEEVDAEARRLRVRAKAREKTGGGSAELTVAIEVAAADAGGSEVSLDASASVSGRLVTLGRGMIDIVSEQVLSDFVSCLSSMLGASVAAENVAAASDAAQDAAPAAESPVGAPPVGGPTPAPRFQAPPPASALGILWRALRSWLRRLLGRA